jgi:hypothetical protein
MTPEQRAVLDARAESHAENLDLRQQALDLRRQISEQIKGLTPGQREIRQRFLFREADSHDKYVKQADDKDTLAERLQGIIARDNDSTYIDPIKGGEQTLTTARRTQLAEEYMKAKKSADAFRKQAENIRKRYGWTLDGSGPPVGSLPEDADQRGGGFAPPAPGAKPVRRSAAAPAAPQKTYTEADVRAAAIAAGKDPEASIRAARAANLIQ